MSVFKPVGRWLIGFLFGTLLVGVTSPLFVRSYVGRVVDPIRQVVAYPSGVTYRWRGEGHATTVMGPHGMPGQPALDVENTTLRIGLYGDSQVEGVALPDDQKLFAVLQDRLPGTVVYPLAKSGEDASDWLPQMHRVEAGLDVDVHVVVIVDAEDLIAGDAVADGPDEGELRLPNLVADVPDFIVHAGTTLLRDPVTGSQRRLRFGLGPVQEPQSGDEMQPGPHAPGAGLANLSREVAMGRREPTSLRDSRRLGTSSQGLAPLASDRRGSAAGNGVAPWLSNLQAATDQPLLIVFAPRVPEIIDGKIRFEAVDQALRNELQRVLTDAGIDWTDVGDEFRVSASAGKWPHGFHNGQFGVGHLNGTGYAILADRIAALIGKGD